MKLFTEHPREVGETYGEHFMMASSFGVPMIISGCACMLHGIFPFMFESTGSKTIKKLYGRMVTNRVKAENEGKVCHELDWCI